MLASHPEHFVRQSYWKLGPYLIITVSPMPSKKVRYRGWLSTAHTWMSVKVESGRKVNLKIPSEDQLGVWD